MFNFHTASYFGLYNWHGIPSLSSPITLLFPHCCAVQRWIQSWLFVLFRTDRFRNFYFWHSFKMPHIDGFRFVGQLFTPWCCVGGLEYVGLFVPALQIRKEWALDPPGVGGDGSGKCVVHNKAQPSRMMMMIIFCTATKGFSFKFIFTSGRALSSLLTRYQAQQ